MITSDINSEFPLSEDEHTQVLVSNKSDSKQASKRPLTMPTSKPPASADCDKPLLMMQKMHNDLKQEIQDFQEKQQRQANNLLDISQSSALKSSPTKSPGRKLSSTSTP
eukprot:735309-Ditylum_brightwellii.AAC.1